MDVIDILKKEIKNICKQLRVINSEIGRKRETHFVLYRYELSEIFMSMYYFCNLKS